MLLLSVWLVTPLTTGVHVIKGNWYYCDHDHDSLIITDKNISVTELP